MRWWSTAAPVAVALWVMLGLLGCEGPRTAGKQAADTRPTVHDGRDVHATPKPPADGREARVGDVPNDRRDTPPARASTDDPSGARPGDVEVPEYLKVVGLAPGADSARVQVMKVEGRRLALDTRNVTRLRIDREALPLDTNRSIALILDGQGFEWLANSDVEEFVRSENGIWEPVKSEGGGRRP